MTDLSRSKQATYSHSEYRTGVSQVNTYVEIEAFDELAERYRRLEEA